MSGRYVSRVFESDLRHDLKFTAAVFASFADEDGYHIWPSVGEVAYLRGVSERAVQYHVKELRDMEILVVVKAATQRWPAQYRMMRDKLPTRAAYKPRDRQSWLLEPSGESPPVIAAGVQPTAPLLGVKSSALGVKPIAPDPSLDPSRTHTYTARARGAASENQNQVGGESPIEKSGAGEADLPLVGVVTRDRHHLAHAWCGRVCVPKFIHKQFKRALGGPLHRRPRRLRLFYAETLTAIAPTQDIGEEPVKFWRTAFAQRFGSALPDRVRRPDILTDRSWHCPHDNECVSREACIDRQAAEFRAKKAQSG